MKWYCKECKVLHSDKEICPHMQKQLKNHPEWLSEAANFTVIAGEYGLITSNALDTLAQGVNKIAGTNLAYEGTHQFTRDIQVFKRLSDEPFKRAGTFASPEVAKNYLAGVREITKNNPRAMSTFEAKLTGYSQEVDWIRYKQSQLSSAFQKSELLSGNAPGIDGLTVNRFTGKLVNRTTIKASKNIVTKNSTAISDVKEAIEKGYATEKDIIFGPVGTKKAALDAGLKNPVVEQNSVNSINASNARLEGKIESGQAMTMVTSKQMIEKVKNGTIIGAAVGLTISSITNYIRYRNGEITKEEAFSEVSESTIKSAVVGGATAGVTIFLPAGPLGFIAGVAIGIYLDALCTNVLDEIYGKGAFGAILSSSGYVYGLTSNLGEYINKIASNIQTTELTISESREIISQINNDCDDIDKMKGELL